jgi:antitoxin FitA
MKPERNLIGVTMGTNFTLKNIPEDLYRKVRENAERNQRSVNGEIISILAAATASKRMPVGELLARARDLRARTRGRLTGDVLDRARREGRP